MTLRALTVLPRLLVLLCWTLGVGASLSWGQAAQPSPTGEVFLTESQAAGLEGCTPFALYKVRDAEDAAAVDRRCNANGDGLERRSGGGGSSVSMPGIVFGADAVQSLAYENPKAVAGTFSLDSTATFWAVTVGAGGATGLLPSRGSLQRCPVWEPTIVDTGVGNFTLVPAGADTIKGVAGPLTIRGQHSAYRITCGVGTDWKVERLIPQPIMRTDQSNTLAAGTTLDASAATVLLPATILLPANATVAACNAGAGDTNTATGGGDTLQHNLTCPLPANFLTQDRTLSVCASWSLTTGSVAPGVTTRLRAGATVLASFITYAAPVDNISDDEFTVCYLLRAHAAPSAASAVYTGLLGGLTGLNSGFNRNNTPQPVTLATNGALTVNFESEWGAAGTGVNTIRLNFITFGVLN